MDVLQARPPAAPDHHPAGARERDRRGRRDRRLDQRRAAPAGDRARGGRAARHRRLRPHQRARAAARRSQAGRPVRRDRPVPRRRHSRWSRKRLLDGGFLHADADHRHRPDDRRARARRDRDRRTRRSSGRSSNPLKPTGGLVILKGNLAPEGASSRSPATTCDSARGPGARVRQRGGGVRGGRRPARSRAGDVVVIRYEGPSGGPGMREMLGVTAAIVGRRARRFGRAGHRRPLLGRDARPDGRPRRARGGARRPDRRRPRRRHHHASTSRRRTLDRRPDRRGARRARSRAGRRRRRRATTGGDGEVRAAGLVSRDRERSRHEHANRSRNRR